ncbi:hypothetical protein C8Q78DRAFT_717826 [Trametes maxima]|nr:hypothetical protein C8Q78DRAFT_717826 [Trametes maxima]
MAARLSPASCSLQPTSIPEPPLPLNCHSVRPDMGKDTQDGLAKTGDTSIPSTTNISPKRVSLNHPAARLSVQRTRAHHFFRQRSSTTQRDQTPDKRTRGSSPSGSKAVTRGSAQPSVASPFGPMLPMIPELQTIFPAHNPFPQAPARTQSTIGKFWYPDGNIVIRLGGMFFKLHQSRLASHSVYFSKRFEAASDGTVEGYPVYGVPPELDLTDFELLLEVIETPLMYTDYSPTQSEATSLLRAAHTLSCSVILSFAKEHLCALWDHSRPPAPHTSPYISTLFPGPSTTANDAQIDDEPRRTFYDAIWIIQLARRYNIPRLLKRPFYELITSPDFFATVFASRDQIRLPDGDLLRLYHAREVLQNRWRDAVVVAPNTDDKGNSTCHPKGHSCQTYPRHGTRTKMDRSSLWRDMVLKSGSIEPGAADPMRYDLLGALEEDARQGWCRWCLMSWEETLTAKRKEWWALLDDLLLVNTV